MAQFKVHLSFGQLGVVGASMMAWLSMSGCADEEKQPVAEPVSTVTSPYQVTVNAHADTNCMTRKMFTGNTIKVYMPNAADFPNDSRYSMVTSTARAGLESRIRDAIMKWVDAVRPVSNVPLISRNDIVFTSAGWDYQVDWSASPFVGGVCWPAGGPGGVQLCDVGDDIVVHELGHAFCLENEYAGNPCQPGQEDSIMCQAHATTNLSNDDIDGVQENFCGAFPDKCKRQWTAAGPWCVGGKTLLGDFNGDKRADLVCVGAGGGTSVALANSEGKHPSTSWTSAYTCGTDALGRRQSSQTRKGTSPWL